MADPVIVDLEAQIKAGSYENAFDNLWLNLAPMYFPRADGFYSFCSVADPSRDWTQRRYRCTEAPQWNCKGGNLRRCVVRTPKLSSRMGSEKDLAKGTSGTDACGRT